MTGNSRENVLKLLGGEELDYVPNFSGMGNITLYGMKELGYRFIEVHTDARKMAAAAASTHRLFGLESVVVPFDMGIEAEALGAEVKYYDKGDDTILYPTMRQKLADNVEDLIIAIPEDLANTGRIPVVTEAIRILKGDVGDEVAVGAWVLGPFTLAGQIVELEDLLKKSFKKRNLVNGHLEKLTEYLTQIIGLYLEAGADYITVREMGATSDVLSPRMFGRLVLPHLQRLFAAIDAPKVLHICGNTNPIVELMAQAGADALSVDQKNDLRRTRGLLPDTLLFGNYDPFGLLTKGQLEDVRRTIKEIIDNGADAIWPGCDIWPTVPPENMRAMVETTRQYGKRRAHG